MYVFTIKGETTSPHTRREAALFLAEELAGSEVKMRRERDGAFVSGTVVELAAEVPASLAEAEVLLDFGADEVARVGVIGTEYAIEIRRTENPSADELEEPVRSLARCGGCGGTVDQREERCGACGYPDGSAMIRHGWAAPRAIGGEWALDDGKLTIGIDEELAEKLAED